jgi:hypothetical protein
MDDPKIEIIFTEDSVGGPVADYMRQYSSKDFDTFVVRQMSDGTRRDIATESADLANKLFEIFDRLTVKADFEYLRDSLIAERKANARLLSSMRREIDFDHVEPQLDGSFGKQVAHYSGPEFYDLAKIAVTIGGSALTLAAVKAIKDIAVAWIKARGARKLTVKVGGNTITIQGSASERELGSATEQLRKIAAANPEKEKPLREKTPTLAAHKKVALPATEKEPQPGRKKRPTKKAVRPKQQS